MTDDELNRLAALIALRQPSESGVPRELNDPTTPPELRAQVLDSFTARLMDKPQSTWSEAERRCVREKTQQILRDLGY